MTRFPDHAALSSRPRRPPILGVLALLCVLTPVAACGVSGSESGQAVLTRSEFIDVMVALRSTRLDLEGLRELPDSVRESRFVERRDSILRERDITEEELYAFVARHPDLEYQKEVWDTISERLRRPLDPAGPGPDSASPRPRPPVFQPDGPTVK